MCALRFLDSFDHLNSVTLGDKYTSVTGSPGVDLVIGRHGSWSLANSWASLWSVNLTLDPQPIWIMGFAFQLLAFPAAAESLLVQWRDGTTVQMALGVNASGQLTLWRGGGVLLATATPALTAGTFHYLEWRVTFHGSAGEATVRLNGVTVIHFTGAATIASAQASANNFCLGNVGALSLGMPPLEAAQYYDDLYVCDGTGPVNNTLLGDCRVDCLFPNGDGTHQAWTPSSGTAHFPLVAEPIHTGDTTYLSTLTSGARETHAFSDAPPTMLPVIYGVQHSIAARKDDVGVRELKPLLISGGTPVVGATTYVLDVAYRYYGQRWDSNPVTETPWTPSAINALEAGVECP